MSISSDATSAVTNASMSSPSVPIPSSGPHSSGFSITSIVNPPSGETQYRPGGPALAAGISHGHLGFVTVPSSDESWPDYSHDSSPSPLSDYHPRFGHRTSISSSTSVADIYSNMASPLIRTTMAGWEPLIMPPSVLPPGVLAPETTGFAVSTPSLSFYAQLLRLISLFQSHPYHYPSPTWMDMSGWSFEESFHPDQASSQVMTDMGYLIL
jgi:hypothetical protein